jgi:hypothetical protein
MLIFAKIIYEIFHGKSEFFEAKNVVLITDTITKKIAVNAVHKMEGFGHLQSFKIVKKLQLVKQEF